MIKIAILFIGFTGLLGLAYLAYRRESALAAKAKLEVAEKRKVARQKYLPKEQLDKISFDLEC